jgi:thiopurine S-methyltransferase
MAELDLSGSAWDKRYQVDDIGWDLGDVSPPLKAYFDQLENKNLRILIPGGGNSYEAEYLFNLGFRNVHVVDVSKTALQNLKKRLQDFPDDQLIHGNFFEVEDNFDLIIEQTFFCAILPKLRRDYGVKMNQLLNPNGELVGVLFNVPLFSNRPPFGGSKNEYVDYFSPYFNFEIFEKCYNSHPSRQGKELFIKLSKKQ